MQKYSGSQFEPYRGPEQVIWYGLPKSVLVRLNHLYTSVGRFQSTMLKWDIDTTSICDCDIRSNCSRCDSGMPMALCFQIQRIP